MNRFFDLRFVIGLFFLIMGAMMLLHALFGDTKTEHNPQINLYSSFTFLAFAIFMLILSFKDGSEKKVEE